ncbi:MAG: hypothetical protein FWD61_10255 [Phycisphaerales bacterium]|nr:hypothetical protein [Phycisphaerales bacterium]
MTQSTPPPGSADTPEARRAFTMHERLWQQNRYVYPVVSRRAKGISIGINLNPDKVCNFNCLYCCVDRKISSQSKTVELSILRQELADMLQLARSGDIYKFDPFDKIPNPLRRINDVAFSGDGEPTSCPNFPEACHLATELTRPSSNSSCPDPIKLVVITNATLFQQPKVAAVLTWLNTHNPNSEIWAKLDVGSDAYYHLINRSAVSFKRIMGNILWYSQMRPIVIQSLFMNVFGRPPGPEEIDAYITRLVNLLAAKGKIKLVQLYTVARRTNEAYVTPLSEPDLQSIAARVRAAIPTIPVEVYP